MNRRVSGSSRPKITLKEILRQARAERLSHVDERWKGALLLGVPEDELTKCLEDIANQRLPPRPRRLRRRQVEAFAERLREDAKMVSHLNVLHSDVLPGLRPSHPSRRFERLLQTGPGYHLLLPEMLTHYANNLDRLEIGKRKPETPRQRSQQESLALELEVVHLIVVASTGIDLPTGRVERDGGAFSGGEINLQPSYLCELAASLIQAAYDAGGVNCIANPDNLRMAYHRRTLQQLLKK